MASTVLHPIMQLIGQRGRCLDQADGPAQCAGIAIADAVNQMVQLRHGSIDRLLDDQWLPESQLFSQAGDYLTVGAIRRSGLNDGAKHITIA